MGTMMTLHKWAHRKGIARTLNTSSGGYMGERGSAYLETRGPAWLGEHLWRFALLGGTYRPPVDLDTLRVTKRQKLARGHYRWEVSFDRLGAL